MRTCPICGKKYSEYPAISRVDNETEIFPDCGLDEALAIFLMFKKIEEEGVYK